MSVVAGAPVDLKVGGLAKVQGINQLIRNSGTAWLISASLGVGIDLLATFARQRQMIASRFSVMNSCSICFLSVRRRH